MQNNLQAVEGLLKSKSHNRQTHKVRFSKKKTHKVRKDMRGVQQVSVSHVSKSCVTMPLFLSSSSSFSSESQQAQTFARQYHKHGVRLRQEN